jgi:hypothetical protein
MAIANAGTRLRLELLVQVEVAATSQPWAVLLGWVHRQGPAPLLVVFDNAEDSVDVEVRRGQRMGELGTGNGMARGFGCLRLRETWEQAEGRGLRRRGAVTAEYEACCSAVRGCDGGWC